MSTMNVETPAVIPGTSNLAKLALVVLVVLALLAPFGLYPIFLMKALCFALFAAAFNLLLGYGGLLSFGHAAFFGSAAYITAHVVKVWGWPPEVGLVCRRRGRGTSWAWSSAGSRSGVRASISPWSRWRSPRWSISWRSRPSSPMARTASRPCRAASS